MQNIPGNSRLAVYAMLDSQGMSTILSLNVDHCRGCVISILIPSRILQSLE